MRALVLLAALLTGCASVPDAVPAAMDARADIEEQAARDMRATLDAALVELDDALYQWREAEHEARLRGMPSLTVDGVLNLRQVYATVEGKNAALLAGFRARRAAIEARLAQAGELDAGVRRVLEAMRERATAHEGLTSAAIEATAQAAAADTARRVARAERKRREAEEAAEAAEAEHGE